MDNIKSLHWFRQDLRLSDNPALHHASKNGQVLPVYILDDQNSGDLSMGRASRFWLHHSLKNLNRNVNNNLSLYQGDPLKTLIDITDRNNITAVYWNRCYEPWRIKRDTEIKSAFEAKGISVLPTMVHFYGNRGRLKKMMVRLTKFLLPSTVRDALTQKILEGLYPKSVLRISLLTIPPH